MSYAEAYREGTPVNGASVYRIPEQFLPDLEKKVAKINKVAEKLDKPLVELTLTDEVTTVEVNVGGRIASRVGRKMTYKARYVTVKGNTPVLDGWRFLAVVLHSRQGNEFMQVPQEFTHLADQANTDLAAFVYTDKHCDHCNLPRPRNATYLVRHDVTGDIKQVGSTCLGDFTGFHSPQAAAKACENIFRLFGLLKDYSVQVPRTTKTFMLEDWMAFVAVEISQNGWRSRGGYGPDSTADAAKTAIINYVNQPNLPYPADEHFATAKRVIEWARNVDATDNDFLRGMQACLVDEINEDDMGRTAAAFPAMWRAEREAAAAAKTDSSEWFGTTGEKLNLALTVTYKGRPYENNYGGFTTNIFFTDPQGRKFKWYCTAARNDMEVGQTYSVNANIKAHDTDRKTGEKMTIITRAKVIESTPDITALVS